MSEVRNIAIAESVRGDDDFLTGGGVVLRSLFTEFVCVCVCMCPLLSEWVVCAVCGVEDISLSDMSESGDSGEEHICVVSCVLCV